MLLKEVFSPFNTACNAVCFLGIVVQFPPVSVTFNFGNKDVAKQRTELLSYTKKILSNVKKNGPLTPYVRHICARVILENYVCI